VHEGPFGIAVTALSQAFAVPAPNGERHQQQRRCDRIAPAHVEQQGRTEHDQQPLNRRDAEPADALPEEDRAGRVGVDRIRRITPSRHATRPIPPIIDIRNMNRISSELAPTPKRPSVSGNVAAPAVSTVTSSLFPFQTVR
jgi:hypothetical protein